MHGSHQQLRKQLCEVSFALLVSMTQDLRIPEL